MTREAFKALVQLLMWSHPWPVETLYKNENEPTQDILKRWADIEAQHHGCEDWVEAYHSL